MSITKQTTARQAYFAKQVEIAERIAALQAYLLQHSEQAQAGTINWAHVGDLTAISSRLDFSEV